MEALANKIFKSFLPDKELKDDQLKAIELLLSNQRALVIQPTGWGKSAVYFITAKILRDQNRGITFVISPLKALIRNQIDAATKFGLKAFTINSDNTNEWENVNKAIIADQCDLLIVAPERLDNDYFKEKTLPLIENGPGVGLIVVDEAHCISDWGHDFRPKYKKIIQFVNTLKNYVPMLATTATANHRVAEDIKQQLGNNIEIIRGSLVRENFNLRVIERKYTYEKLGWLEYHLTNGNLEGSGIIYCTSQKGAERVTEYLKLKGIQAEFYHAGITDPEVKKNLEDRLIRNELKVLVATIALGMGFDKSDVRFVIHYNLSSSLITYYQEIGRAGRDGGNADIILLYSPKDVVTLRKMINSGIVNQNNYIEVLDIINKQPSSVYDILTQYNLPKSQMQKILDLLEADDLIYKEGPKYYRSANIKDISLLKNSAIKALKLQELNDMVEYSENCSSCLLNFLIKNLGEPEDIHCHLCQNCNTSSSPFMEFNQQLVDEALEYLESQTLEIKPIDKWPMGGCNGNRGAISLHLQHLKGRALSLYENDGVGELVYKNRYEDKFFGNDLVQYCADYIQRHYLELNSPQWITAVPSMRNPELVPGFAYRVAQKLNLPYKQIIQKKQHTEEQKFMKNANKQAANNIDAFEVIDSPLDGPVLLIDDIMSSGWTFAICAMRLKEVGCSSVTPLALSKT
ncbi:RecQ family ATP-dependent DNA helicase [Lysinibacillus sp. NPDC093210]|uniref:RecQ family ATP-dependent DNA helicase n=1 Tax=Lysinibacillus sp. NPDC093210 TaxID=3364133 RepID=UPI00381CE78B